MTKGGWEGETGFTSHVFVPDRADQDTVLVSKYFESNRYNIILLKTSNLPEWLDSNQGPIGWQPSTLPLS